MSAFEGKTDRQLYVEANRIGGELIRRYEQFLELYPSRRDERQLGREQASRIQIAERTFRGFYERCRDIREAIEDAADDYDELERPD
jgi:hypothetical protein